MADPQPLPNLWAVVIGAVLTFLSGLAALWGSFYRSLHSRRKGAPLRENDPNAAKTEQLEITGRHEAHRLDVEDRARFTRDLMDRIAKLEADNATQAQQVQQHAVALAEVRALARNLESDNDRLIAERDGALQLLAESEARERALHIELQDLRRQLGA